MSQSEYFLCTDRTLEAGLQRGRPQKKDFMKTLWEVEIFEKIGISNSPPNGQSTKIKLV